MSMMYTEVKDCIKKLCGFVREQTMKIINFKKKNMNLLTKQQQEPYGNLLYL